MFRRATIYVLSSKMRFIRHNIFCCIVRNTQMFTYSMTGRKNKNESTYARDISH